MRRKETRWDLPCVCSEIKPYLAISAIFTTLSANWLFGGRDRFMTDQVFWHCGLETLIIKLFTFFSGYSHHIASSGSPVHITKSVMILMMALASSALLRFWAFGMIFIKAQIFVTDKKTLLIRRLKTKMEALSASVVVTFYDKDKIFRRRIRRIMLVKAWAASKTDKKCWWWSCSYKEKWQNGLLWRLNQPYCNRVKNSFRSQWDFIAKQ